MKVYGFVQELHRFTMNEWAHTDNNSGIAKRLYIRPLELDRLGKPDETYIRTDIQSSAILRSYLARKIFINEKYIRGGYPLIDVYEKEIEFTKGLWDIFCELKFGELLPELPVFTTYRELQLVLDNAPIHSKFSIYSTANDVVSYNILNNGDIDSLNKFDEACKLPKFSTRLNRCRSNYVNRKETDENLISCAMGMFKLDFLKTNEPYPLFWKERAEKAINKMYLVNINNIIVRLRNADMYNQKHGEHLWPPVKSYVWNKKP